MPMVSNGVCSLPFDDYCRVAGLLAFGELAGTARVKVYAVV